MSTVTQGSSFASDFLEHFGVKGMKWGQRRKSKDSKVSNSREESKAGDSEDFTRTAATAVKVKTSGMRSLSNKELRDLVDRINLEQNFARATTPEAKKKSPLSVGAKYVSGKITKTADMTVDTILKTAVQIKVTDDLKKRMATPVKQDNKQLKMFDYV